MRPMLCLFWFLAACAPVRDGGGGAACPDDDFEPSNTQDEAWDIGDGGSFDLVLCPGNDDWLRAGREEYQYVEAHVQWAEAPHTGVIELWSPQGLMASTEAPTVQDQWLTSRDFGPHWLHGAQGAQEAAEDVTVDVTVTNDVIVGR